MERLEFNDVLDEYLSTGNMSSEDYEALDDEQVNIIQAIKRAFSRLSKVEHNSEEHIRSIKK